MAGFNPSEPRVGAGSAAGGQWGGGSAAKKKAPAKAKAPAKPAGHAMGAARNASAKGAQDDAHKAAYDRLMAMPAAKRAAYAKGLSDADLEKATEAAYSFKSADPDVVRARVALANEASKRGIDIRKHGAQGGGTAAKAAPAKAAPRKAATPAQARAVAHVQARKAAAKAPAKPAPKAPSAAGGGSMRARAQ